MPAVSNPDSQFDLDSCAREPIHIPGGIQPHGVLMVLDAQTLQVLQSSANARQWLGSPLSQLQPFCSVGGEALAAQLRTWIATLDPTFLRTANLDGRAIQVLGHRTAQGIVLELEEPPRSERETLEALYPRLGRYIEELQSCDETRTLCQFAARQFREITAFDRVLIYRFDPDWNGEVVAEDGNGVLPSYLDLRFPAADIPAQARALYRGNRLRLIPSANYQAVPIEPRLSPVDGTPLDLSQSALRSVSPVHLQYMRNMGTLASMSISILVESQLWGLISCHNAQPRQVNAQVRTACDLLGNVVSLQLTACEQGTYAKRRIELKRCEAELLARLAAANNFALGLVENPTLWLNLCAATGAAVITDTALFSVGQAPADERLRALGELVRERHGGEVFASDALSLQWPEFADIAPQASGVLAIPISQLYPSYIMWFRAEVVSTVRWGGDPRKPAQAVGWTGKDSLDRRCWHFAADIVTALDR